MRTEWSARRTGAETTRKEGNAGSQAEAKVRGCEANQFSPEQGSTDRTSEDRRRVRRLAAQAGPPKIRGERIAAIQTALAEGTYMVTPEQTAEAIISEQQIRDGTAA
jgi:anti-sigma28 factor (negative regulator of flagellin synthesis)